MVIVAQCMDGGDMDIFFFFFFKWSNDGGTRCSIRTEMCNGFVVGCVQEGRVY